MANNRMVMVNTRTGERFFLAKYYPSTGWYSQTRWDKKRDVGAELDAFFHKQDFGDKPYEDLVRGVDYAAGGMYGAEYRIDLEEETPG